MMEKVKDLLAKKCVFFYNISEHFLNRLQEYFAHEEYIGEKPLYPKNRTKKLHRIKEEKREGIDGGNPHHLCLSLKFFSFLSKKTEQGSFTSPSSLLHAPVLFHEVLEGLQLQKGMTVLDGTVGLGGHSLGLLQGIGSEGKLLALDWDERNLLLAKERLGENTNVFFERSSFSALDLVCAKHGISALDGVLLDLGISSAHLDDPERGFSFRSDAPLDMRMDMRKSQTAADILLKYSAEELTRIFREYGEERLSWRIAQKIDRVRKLTPLRTTTELYELIASQTYQAKKVAARIFQALRIEVNEELQELKKSLVALENLVSSGGRVAIISFHSLEDRVVKLTFRSWETQGKWKRVNKKVIIPSPREEQENPRSRSAKLRIVQKI